MLIFGGAGLLLFLLLLLLGGARIPELGVVILLGLNVLKGDRLDWGAASKSRYRQDKKKSKLLIKKQLTSRKS